MSPAEYLLQVPANRIGYTTMNLGHHRGLLDQRRMGEAIITPSHGKSGSESVVKLVPATANVANYDGVKK